MGHGVTKNWDRLHVRVCGEYHVTLIELKTDVFDA